MLAAGQIGIVETRKGDVSDFIADMLELDPQDLVNIGRGAVLAGRALADMGPRGVTKETRRRVLDALRETMQDLGPDKQTPNEPPVIPVRTRYDAGEVLDELGWLPGDLNVWVRCPGTAEGGSDLLVMKYPVTNAQFERFVQAGGTATRRWHQCRRGKERCGYPVVGVSWHEAVAYAAWLTDVLERALAGDEMLPTEDRALVADLLAAGGGEVRLPKDEEWVAMAGGVQDKGRFPWDPPDGPPTEEEEAVLARASTVESGIYDTKPVAMYPLGISQPFELLGLAGNVWEWIDSWFVVDQTLRLRVLKGGSWMNDRDSARCVALFGLDPDISLGIIGFRLVSPIRSDS